MNARMRTVILYCTAPLAVAVAYGVRLVLERFVGQGLPTYITFYPAVILLALMGGFGPGLLATATTVVVTDFFLLHPEGKIGALSLRDMVGQIFFFGIGALISFVAGRYYRLRNRLEATVAERTAELSRAMEENENARAELECRVEERTVELASALNTLRDEAEERLRAMEEVRQKDRLLLQQSRLAAMGEMIGNIAHQWRQPLNTLGLILQELPVSHELGLLGREELDARVAKAMQVLSHMSQTIDDFRNFFRPDKERDYFKVGETVTRTVSLVEGSFRDQQIAIRIEDPEEVTVNGYRNEYSQVILNILINARDAFMERNVAAPRIVRISLCRHDERSILTIADNAGGIPPEIMDKIFEPYFTTKGPDKGTGVGLFMAKTIIERNMNGRLRAANVEGGAVFTIEV